VRKSRAKTGLSYNLYIFVFITHGLLLHKPKKKLLFKIISQNKMASSVMNGHHIEAIDNNNNNDESEFDFKEYYSKEKTLELRDVYIP